MSAKTTLRITRNDALSEIARRVFAAPNDQIDDILNILLDATFYNFRIVEQYDRTDDEHNYSPSKLSP